MCKIFLYLFTNCNVRHAFAILGWQRHISNQNTIAKCRPPQNVTYAVGNQAQYNL